MLEHRGPDDEGFHIAAPVGFAFRRLSIIDLAGGHQPLSNPDGTVWIVFNGEIYNYQPLREKLLAQGHQFSTESDTEVIVHLYEEYGDDCVHQLRGMFSFAVWDGRKRSCCGAPAVSLTSVTFASVFRCASVTEAKAIDATSRIS